MTLLQSEMPSHSHAMGAPTGRPCGRLPRHDLGRPARWTTPQGRTGAVTMVRSVLAAAGGGLPHNNLQPYLTLNFCIALQGVFPARS